jgi:transcription termination/antitermination protein NusA
MEIWRNRVVVEDGEVEDPNSEISLSEARKIEPDFEVGEDVSEEVKLIDLGRRAILALRQNLISKIHEHDNTNLYKQFKDLIGEIYTAEVHHVRPKAVILWMMKETKLFYQKKNKFQTIISKKEIMLEV